MKNTQQFLIDLNLYLQSPLGSVFKFRFNKNVIHLPKNISCLISNNYTCSLILVLPSYNEGDIFPSFCRKKKKNTEVLEKLHDLPKVTQAGSQQAQIIKPKFALL